MTRPTSRVLTLLEILQGGGTRTVGELAGRLGVDGRTVRRYVEHLRDLDVPVDSVRGRHGGYRLLPGYRMPPLMLTEEEALATLLGLVVGAAAGTLPVAAAATEGATAKIRRVLPRPVAARLDALLATMELTGVPRERADPEVDVLLRVAQAARDRTLIVFHHTGRDGRTRERTLAAYGVVAHRGRWYVTGRDEETGELRTFRLDRMSGVTATGSTFEVPSTFDAAAAVRDALAATPWRHAVSVRVRSTAEAVQRRLAPGLATVEALADDPGWVRVRVRAEDLGWVPAELARLDAPFVVEQPAELRDLVRTTGRRLLDAAG